MLFKLLVLPPTVTAVYPYVYLNSQTKRDKSSFTAS